MHKPVTVIALLIFCLVVPAFAVTSVSDTGTWPNSWPRELEKLRKQSRSLVGPGASVARHYAIPFKRREQMEEAWAHLLKVKTKGAPIILVHGANIFLVDNAKAGVVVHCPGGKANNPATPVAPIAGFENPRIRWMNANYIELVVDGKIVDLNRLSLPADTPIIDERFKDAPDK